MAEVTSTPHLDELEQTDKITLTPPPSVKLPKMEELSSSELSDPEPDNLVDEIEPDHYYGGGRIPVFKPVSRARPQGAQLRSSWGVIESSRELGWISARCILTKARHWI